MAHSDFERSAEFDSLGLPDIKVKKTCMERLFPAGFSRELKALLWLSWPLVITYMSSMMLPTISVIFCGQLGATQLDAVSLANSVINITCLSVGIGLATACDTLFSQSFGSGNTKQVGVYVQKAIIIIGLASLPCWAIHLNTEALLLLIGQDTEVAELAGRYMILYFPAVLLNFLFQVFSKWLQAQNIVFPCVVIGLVANLVNAGLHYLLVYTVSMRTDGSALAQVGANLTLLVLTVAYILIGKAYKETWTGWSLDCLQHWGTFIKLAIPGMFMMCLEWWSFEIGTLLSGTLDKTQLGAQSVIFYIESVTITIPFGIGVATSIKVGQYLGSGDADGAKTASRVGLCCCSVIAVLMAVLFFSFRNILPKIFTQEPDVIEKASEILPVLAGFSIFDSVAVVGGGVLRGCGRQTVGAVIAFVGYYVLSLPIGIPLLLLTDLKATGLWLGYMIGLFIEAVCFSILIATTNWDLEAEQAQVRAGVKSDPNLEPEPEEDDPSNQRTLPPTIEEEEGTVPDERTSLLSKPKKRISYADLGTRQRRKSSLTMPRSYSSSNIVNVMHGRRFSVAHDTGRKFSVPGQERRFSGQYTPQIQEDIISKLQQKKPPSTAKLLLMRGAVILVLLGILAAGIIIRLTVPLPAAEVTGNSTTTASFTEFSTVQTTTLLP